MQCVHRWMVVDPSWSNIVVNMCSLWCWLVNDKWSFNLHGL
jgi:hypothetical protein